MPEYRGYKSAQQSRRVTSGNSLPIGLGEERAGPVGLTLQKLAVESDVADFLGVDVSGFVVGGLPI